MRSTILLTIHRMSFRPLIAAVRFVAVCWLVFSYAAMAEETRYYVYVTQKGDTLLKIAGRFLTKRHDWQSLGKLNTIAEPTQIPIGTRIRIPVPAMRADQSGATVVAVQGSADSSRGRLEANGHVTEGESIKTGEGGFVTLRLADGSTLSLPPKSQIELTTARQFANTGGVTDTVVKLGAGRVESIVAKQRSGASRYEVRTATSNMGVRGTVFRAATDAAGTQSGSEVLEGAVGVAAAAMPATKELALPAGFGTITEAGKEPLPPVELLSAPDLSGLPAQVGAGDLAFRYQPIPNALRYRTQIARDVEFRDVLAESVGVEPAAKFDQVVAGAYFLRARGIDKLGLEGRDAVRPLAVDAETAAPTSLRVVSADPAAGGSAAVLTRSPFSEFSWAAVDAARAYHFQIARDQAFTAKIIDDPAIVETHYQSKIPLPPGNFWWRVASVGASGRAGAFSAPQAFLVANNLRLEKPQVEGSSVTLRWDGVTGADYQVQLGGDEYFRKTIQDVTVNEPVVRLEKLPNGFYFARVRLRGGGVHYGPWSSVEPVEIYGSAWLLNVLPR
ncbi:MAG: FecR domain-containing protein [Betaproteobacteria bacterium]|nr:FecR domain-containing protein [Betaproteobacteria bacterium]